MLSDNYFYNIALFNSTNILMCASVCEYYAMYKQIIFFLDSYNE